VLTLLPVWGGRDHLSLVLVLILVEAFTALSGEIAMVRIAPDHF
jgi:hypothetical protein